MIRIFLSMLLVTAFLVPTSAQQVVSLTAESGKDAEKAEELRKQTFAMLRETIADIGMLRTLENRISFSADIADLMWYYDESEARNMFNAAIADFRELTARLDQQFGQLPPETGNMDAAYTAELIKLSQKARIVSAVRQQIANSIAEHDAELALSFYYDSTPSDPRWSNPDSGLEKTLIARVAEKDAAKAVQLGKRTLEKGLDYQHIELLRKLYEKDPDRASEFGASVLSKAKDVSLTSYDMYQVGSLFGYASENFNAAQREGKKAIYSQAEMREMAELIARWIADSEEGGSGLQYLSQIEQFSPGRAAQLKTKFKIGTGGANTSRRIGSSVYASNSASPNYGNANVSSNSAVANRGPSEDDQLQEEMVKLGKAELSGEQREIVVEKARKILMQQVSKEKQIAGLSMLATQVSKAGDHDLASEIMRDAESLVNPYPKNYREYMLVWVLISGYAEAAPDKAFPMLDQNIGRANDLIRSFLHVGEFVDVAEEMIVDGEAQVGAFGGGMVRGLSKELGMVEPTLVTLAKHDLTKLKALTNRFERPEVRMLAKMLVLRALVNKSEEENAANDPTSLK